MFKTTIPVATFLLTTIFTTTGSPIFTVDLLPSQDIALVNVYADPRSNCKSARTPDKLLKDTCYGPVGAVGLEITAIVGSVEGKKCYGMLFYF
jgi:hypothetical protein